MKNWLTVAEAAEYSGVSRDTIYTACERRELRHARMVVGDQQISPGAHKRFEQSWRKIMT